MSQKPLPPFLEKRIKEHYQDRFINEWGGVHLLKSPSLSSSDVLLSSNDYLCLRKNKSLYFNMGEDISSDVLMSSVFLDESSFQTRVENEFSIFFNVQNSILCQSGWAANTGLIQSIADDTTPVYIDILAHMSFHDGVRLANAKSYVFAHNNVNNARKKISQYGPGIIVVDSVYSTNGSLCPLSDFATLAQELDCILVVDESHSAGTHGPEGRGIVNALKLNEKVDFITVSLAKAFAGRAGLITCSNKFKDYFLLESHPSIFSSALMNHDLKWFMNVIPVIVSSDIKREKLHFNSRQIRTSLNQLGYNVSSGTEQIIAVEIGSEKNVQSLQNSLQKKGVYGSVFCYPATTKNKALIRLTINSDLTDSDISRIVDAFKTSIHDV
ncbi:alpha-hydroxyketone-type quorum-sensing autoinducer synthase [Enterobacter kobei]|uniref:alpha-hydroxyketone-type quorum-sensing autoinducer synthase n=1 Tax=Enterobacter kobei TaxID=208224 RepID=UPI002FD74DC5